MSEVQQKKAAADSLILEARARSEESMSQADDLHVIYKEHEEKCREEIAVGKQDLLVMEENLKASTKILAMTKCKPSLLQCGGSHPTSRAMVQAVGDAREAREQLVFVQVSSRRKRRQRRWRTHHRRALRRSTGHQAKRISRHHGGLRHKKKKSAREAAVEVQSIMSRIHQLVNASNSNKPDDILGENHVHRCSIDNNPNCDAFADSMLSMLGDVFCKKFEVENGLQQTEMKCASLTRDYQKQIRDVQNRMSLAGVDFAKATKDKNDEGFAASMKTREVLIKANGGSACPPLEERESCSNVPCPVNCVAGEWQEWSGCTADCGGGIRERSRLELVPAAHGGEPCSLEHIVETCGEESCDENCILSDWGNWTGCSKACGR